jgi:hypothetical protein
MIMKVRRYEVKAVGEKWNQIAEHMPGRWKPVQQQQRWSVCWAGFAIGNLEATNIGGAIVDRFH